MTVNSSGISKVLFLAYIPFICGCSILEKNLYLKPVENNESWTMVHDKNYQNYYVTEDAGISPQYYYACDSISSLQLVFDTKLRPLLVGPPLIPVLPVFPGILFQPSLFQKIQDNFLFELRMKTFNDTEAVLLTEHVHFYFNESLVESYPTFYFREVQTKETQWDSWLWKSNCGDKSKTNNMIRVVGYFKGINPKSIRTIYVKFDNEFNSELHANYKSLKLARKNRLHYFLFILPTH